MKETYENIKLDIYIFQNEDVVATSDPGIHTGEDEFPIMGTFGMSGSPKMLP